MRGVRFAQLTDTHVTRDGPQAQHLRAAIAFINGLRPPATALLLSGDAVNNGQADQYAVLRDVLEGSDAPVYVVPGNHDRREALRATLPESRYPGVGGGRLNYAVDAGPVRLIGLDSSHWRRPGGVLDTASLTWLDESLGMAPERPALIFMHHPPFRTGVNAADAFGFKGLAAFRSIVARRPAVRRIIAGHIHCERHAAIAQALATTSISSTPQVVPEVFERHILGLRPEPAGFALHDWTGDAFTSTTYVADGRGGFAARPTP